MSGEEQSSQDACGCCAGVGIQAPSLLYNRPGLAAIAYRIGTHSEVLASLQARLSSQDYPALAKLRTRDSDDFSIALLDAYACMADVLSFYQERLANESYLRTAGERLSLSELARLIGYRLKPGVAAETYLAFTLQEPPPQPVSSDPKQATGVPDKITLDIGIKVQSIPGPDEKPQTFETVESIEARPAWNVLLPKMHEMKLPVFGTKIVYLQGTATQLKAGDALLFVGTERENSTGNENWDFRRVQSVVLDSIADRTIVTLGHGLGTASPFVAPAADPKVYALRQRASLFGYNAPDWRIMSNDIKCGYMGLPTGSTITATEWPGFTIADISDPPTDTATGTGLFGEYFDNKNLSSRKLSRTDTTVNFEWGSGSPDALIGADTFSVRWSGWVHAPITGGYTFYTTSDDGVRLWVDNQLLINNWTDHGATENSGGITLTAGKKYDIKLEYYENGGAATIKLLWAPPGQAKQIIPQERLYPRNVHTLHLDALYPQIVHDGWLVLSIPEYQELYQVDTAGEDARASFTLSGKTTRLKVKGENLRELFNERLRETAVFAHSEKLTLAETPITIDVSGDFLRVDRKVEELLPGRKLILSGTTTAGDEVSEVLTLLKTEADGNTSKLFFTTSLQHQYQRGSVKLYANVALATHGETVHQTLGSGAARLSNQRYTLKHTPLTFVGAENETGAEAALEVRVNDIRWHETPTLYQAGADDRSYVLRAEEDGAGTIQFGDGRNGARLPTGQDNLRAVYRKGIGSAGNLQAGQLSQLLSRPLGLKAVSNPLPAAGGVNADSSTHARRNMPLGVRTLGRVVSVQDYEDYALAFTGIAKAQATVLNTRAGRTVFITVAGDDGVQPPDLTLAKLLNTLKQNGDPLVHCEIKPYNEATFHLALRIKCDPDHDGKKVLADVETALRIVFSFDARDFGQIVARSEIIATAQEVEGVLGVDLDRFYRGATISLEQRLTPAAATTDAQGNGIADELLLLDTGPFDYLEEMP
ncbi:MAG: putative baseplate assembly protein [Candidatus Nitrotoga sp.]